MPEPYYQDDFVALYHGDCREIAAWQFANYLITDPPYGMAFRSSMGGSFGDSEIAGDEDTAVRDWVLSEWGAHRMAPASTPTQKPVTLLRDLIAKCPAGVICDPFAGSGSTLRAAKDLGRQAIGVELEERYCDAAARLLSQEVFDFGEAA